jgi:hypothetical protein
MTPPSKDYWDLNFLRAWDPARFPKDFSGRSPNYGYAAFPWPDAPSYEQMWGSLRSLIASGSWDDDKLRLLAWALREQGGWDYLADHLPMTEIRSWGPPSRFPWEMFPSLGDRSSEAGTPPKAGSQNTQLPYLLYVWDAGRGRMWIHSWAPAEAEGHWGFRPEWQQDDQGWIPAWQNPPWCGPVYNQVSRPL